MSSRRAIEVTLATLTAVTAVCLGATTRTPAEQAASTGAPQGPAPAILTIDENSLREYAGVYQWGPDAFIYLQMWDEFTGFGKPRELVSFNESGEVRTLYPTARDQFFTGPGMAVSTSIESRVEFQRDASGKITSFTSRRGEAAPRIAQRVDTERHEDVRFANGTVQLAGTLISPTSVGRHAAIVLVHGSGAENREYMVPWARFLVRHGVAILGFDKRGVGASTGDWNVATFPDLAGDVVAAVDYLKTRRDIDGTRIGLLGLSQAGWIMPLAAVRTSGVACLISISGAGVSPAETTLAQARNELTMTGMPRQTVEDIVALQTLLYNYARTGQGWNEYLAAREKLAARMGPPPPNIPGTPDDPYIQTMKRYYFYDPVPTLRQLKTPTLGLWGELDNNIVPDKNKAAWAAALQAGGNRDFTLTVLPKADHAMWEAKTGSNAEMKSLQRFVPDYFTTVRSWLAKR